MKSRLCDQCGAQLPAPVKNTLTCTYCGTTFDLPAPAITINSSGGKIKIKGHVVSGELIKGDHTVTITPRANRDIVINGDGGTVEISGSIISGNLIIKEQSE